MAHRHHCFVIRDASDGAETSWKTYHYQFESQSEYDAFLNNGALVPENEGRTWGEKVVTVPAGRVESHNPQASPDRAAAIQVAFSAIAEGESAVHQFENLAEDTPVFVETDGKLIQVDPLA